MRGTKFRLENSVPQIPSFGRQSSASFYEDRTFDRLQMCQVAEYMLPISQFKLNINCFNIIARLKLLFYIPQNFELLC